MPLDRIYLDNAATSWPKPEAVYAAIDHYQRNVGAPAGRGVYSEAMQVAQAIRATRQRLARLMGASSPENIVFTANGTDALNLALHGALSGGVHVVTTVVEHNSVLRPLKTLEKAGQINVTRVLCGPDGIVDAREIAAAIRPDTRLVALAHASNVTGALQPVAEVGALNRAHGWLFLVDAAQTLGELAIDVSEWGVDLLAAPGHKGLRGPLGTGLLYLRPGVELSVNATRQGGTGSRSESDEQPSEMPDKYESGNLNVPGIMGLSAAVEVIEQRSVADLRRHALELSDQLTAGLASIAGLRLYGPRDPLNRASILSMSIDGYDPQEVAILLDSAYRVQTRPGLHCAPLMHRALGTLESGGTVRFSWGPFTTANEIEQAIQAVREIATTVI